MHFVIVDDDPSVIQILKNIIAEYQLGMVMGSCGDGIAGARMIRELQPNIALVDILMPQQDGVAMLAELRDLRDKVSFIVISENQSQALLSMVYEQGIEYYIHKPINVVEVVSVIRKTTESRHLKKFLSMASQTVAQSEQFAKQGNDDLRKRKLNRLFYELGIVGEAGSEAVRKIIEIMLANRKEQNNNEQLPLAELYKQVSAASNQDVKTIEQRIRRTIVKALTNLASIGLEDFHNERFQEYNNVLFDFKEVRQEMNFLQSKSPYRGKVNIRKFIEGMFFLLGD